jgi:hypothetical protein
MRLRRITITISVIVWLAVLGSVHSTMEQVAGTYHRRFGSQLSKVEPPPVSKYLGLPILGHGRPSIPEHWIWYAARLLVALPPAAFAVMAWRVRNGVRLDGFLLYGALVYAVIVSAVASAVAAALWIPFACC